MNVKNHHFSIRPSVSSRTIGKRKRDVAFLHSRLFTLRGFAYTPYTFNDRITLGSNIIYKLANQ